MLRERGEGSLFSCVPSTSSKSPHDQLVAWNFSKSTQDARKSSAAPARHTLAASQRDGPRNQRDDRPCLICLRVISLAAPARHKLAVNFASASLDEQHTPFGTRLTVRSTGGNSIDGGSSTDRGKDEAAVAAVVVAEILASGPVHDHVHPLAALALNLSRRCCQPSNGSKPVGQWAQPRQAEKAAML